MTEITTTITQEVISTTVPDGSVVNSAITQQLINVTIAEDSAIGTTITETPIAVTIIESAIIETVITSTPIVTTISAGLPEAPADGSTYGRKDGGWIAVTVTETDPVFLLSAAAGISPADIANWDSKAAGDHTHAGGGGTWGSITGTLSDQLDLQSVLDVKVEKDGDVLTGDLVGPDFVKTRSGSVTRSGGYISQVAKDGGRTLVVSRSGGYISSISDGIRTWTFTRDDNNVITSWSVT